MAEPQDIQRLRHEYADRKAKYGQSDKYSLFNPTQNFFVQSRKRLLLSALRKHNISSLQNLKLLEVGCGSGGVLAEYFSLGASLDNLFGIDLLFDRLQAAKAKLQASNIHNANGEFLPFRNSSFDLVLQYTAFSSILDRSIKHNLAREMLRVLRPGGLIVWYDFWLNPTNRQTQGIKPQEIRDLFPNCTYRFHHTTLAPPIARRIVPISWMLATALEKLKLFNSHYLAIIQPVR